MEYINIISKEAITTIPDSTVYLILGVVFLLLSISIVCMFVAKNQQKTIGIAIIVGICAIVFEFIALCYCSAFHGVPTGRYEYKATIDKDRVTVDQYEEFIEKYNPTIEDGIYCWEE